MEVGAEQVQMYVEVLPEPLWAQKHCVPVPHRAGALVLIS